jgi:hypothetical protein
VCSVEVALMCCYIHFPLKFTSDIAKSLEQHIFCSGRSGHS